MLVHLNISGTQMDILQLQYLSLKGFRKAKFLMCIHMTNMNLNKYENMLLNSSMMPHLKNSVKGTGLAELDYEQLVYLLKLPDHDKQQAMSMFTNKL